MNWNDSVPLHLNLPQVSASPVCTAVAFELRRGEKCGGSMVQYGEAMALIDSIGVRVQTSGFSPKIAGSIPTGDGSHP